MINFLVSKRINSSSGNGYNNYVGVNFKMAMGLLYDLYDIFSIELLDFQTGVFASSINPSSKVCFIVLNGLPFINSGYTTGDNSATNAVVGTINLTLGATVGTQNYTNAILNKVYFSKHNTVSDITISFINVNTGQLMFLDSGGFSGGNFLFRISGSTLAEAHRMQIK